MFPRNAWYVACTPAEIDEKPLGRTVCGERIVFFRGPQGQAVGLEDWCPHRGAPLSLGRVVRDGESVRREAGVFVYWFVADGELTAQHRQRMWWMARDLLTRGVLQRWAYVSCFSACPPGQEEATYARMREWIAAAVPQFQRAAGPSTPAR